MKLLGKRARKGDEGSIKLVPEEGKCIGPNLLSSSPTYSKLCDIHESHADTAMLTHR